MIETFVLTELARQLSSSSERARLYNYRTKDRGEVDDPDGRVVAIEVKAGATVRAEDLACLHHIAQRLGSRLVAGYVFHTAQQTLPRMQERQSPSAGCRDHEPLCRDGGRN